jgi:hypothetical protein
LLSGALISYEKANRQADEPDLEASKKPTKSKNINGQPSLHVLVGTLGGILGLVLALPPLVSDTKWRSAQVGRSLEALEGTMSPGLFNLPNSNKYLSNIQTIEENKLFDLSHKYALEAVKWNPESFELWKVFYLIRNSTPEEKALALENMKRLDPLNPDVTSIK